MKHQTSTTPRPGSFKERRAQAAHERVQTENQRPAVTRPLSPEIYSLHIILERAILQSLAGGQSGEIVTAAAECAARAFAAGLAAFTAPAELLTGDGANTSIPVTVNYGGAKDAAVQRNVGLGALGETVARDEDAHMRKGRGGTRGL